MPKFFCLFLALLISVFNNIYCAKYELSIVAITQNEEKFIKEWVEFHQKQGVDHIYLISNCSSNFEGYRAELKEYIKSGYVSLKEYNVEATNVVHWNQIQCDTYYNAKAYCNSKWVAFIDTDEFLYCPKGSLKKNLKKYSNYGGVGVNWVMFGSSNVENANGRLLDKLLLRAPMSNPANVHIKTICQVQHMAGCKNPHYVIYKNGKYTVNENFERIDGPFSPHSVSTFRINHYWARDLDFFYNEKIPRRQKWYADASIIEDEQKLNIEYDDDILLKL